jgi:hypothetical protein
LASPPNRLGSIRESRPTTSTNPVLVMLGLLLILAWKNAGYLGLDYFLLPIL